MSTAAFSVPGELEQLQFGYVRCKVTTRRSRRDAMSLALRREALARSKLGSHSSRGRGNKKTRGPDM